MAATSPALLPGSPEPDALGPQHATGLLLARQLKPRIEHSRENRATAPFPPDQLRAASSIDACAAAYVERARAFCPRRQGWSGARRR
jgi:hypothetical protein